MDASLRKTRDVLRSVALAAGNRSALFRRASEGARDITGAVYGQLFALEAIEAKGKQDLALSVVDPSTGSAVTLDLATQPAGHAVLTGAPQAFELHADEFWYVLFEPIDALHFISPRLTAPPPPPRCYLGPLTTKDENVEKHVYTADSLLRIARTGASTCFPVHW